jgi:hypothetical protein
MCAIILATVDFIYSLLRWGLSRLRSFIHLLGFSPSLLRLGVTLQFHAFPFLALVAQQTARCVFSCSLSSVEVYCDGFMCFLSNRGSIVYCNGMLFRGSVCPHVDTGVQASYCGLYVRLSSLAACLNPDLFA